MLFRIEISQKQELGIVGFGKKRFFHIHLSHRFVSVIRSKEDCKCSLTKLKTNKKNYNMRLSTVIIINVIILVLLGHRTGLCMFK